MKLQRFCSLISVSEVLTLNSLCFAKATKKAWQNTGAFNTYTSSGLARYDYYRAAIRSVRTFWLRKLTAITDLHIGHWWSQLFLLDLRQTIFCFYNMDKPHAFPASIFASHKRPAKGKVKLTIMISLSFALVPWPNPNVATIYYIEHMFFCQCKS